MKALLGWYACSFAAEPFLVSAVATYVPLFLEQLARSNAVWAIDRRTPCLSEPADSPGLPPVPIPSPACVVRVLWWYIDTSTLPLYTFSVSVLVQTVIVISMSGIADKGAHRKRLLLMFAVIGAVSVILMYFISTDHYYLAALLAISANACFGAVSVCTNAYLPELVSQEVDRQKALRWTAYHRYYGASQEPDPVDPAPIASKISGRGMAVGYSAALFVQVSTMLILFKYSHGDRSTYMLQFVIALVGLWWLIFQIPVALYLPSSHLSPDVVAEAENSLLRGTAVVDESSEWPLDNTESFWAEVLYGWKSLGQTIPRATQLRDVSIFLVAWFVISDAITTINSTAILFARGNLRMGTPALAGVGLITVCFGILGSLQIRKFKSSEPVATLVAIVLFAACIPLYGVLGFFTPYLGLREQWEMYLLAAWYGIALGALNTMCRSVFSLLIPRGHETMFFALFSLTDKGSSVLGPAITGFITDKTHNIRYTFYFLLCMALIGSMIFTFVNVRRGQEDAKILNERESSVAEDQEIRIPDRR